MEYHFHLLCRLGHESMSTTSGFYATATLEMMSDAMKKTAPSLENEDKLWKKDSIKKALFSLLLTHDHTNQ